jgi:hypothetical protein
LVPEAVKLTQVNLTYNGGIAEGTMQWWRDGDRQRLEIVFDVPENFKRHAYEDVVVVNDDVMQVHEVRRTGQVALTSPGDLAAMTPVDWLLAGSRLVLAQLADRGPLEAFECPDGRYFVRAGDPLIEYRIDPKLEYAVTAWAYGDGSSDGTIDYDITTGGVVVPTGAIVRLRAPGGADYARTSALEVVDITFDPPDPQNLRFIFKEGMLVADNRPAHEGRGPVQLFRVGEGGLFEEVPSETRPDQTLSALTGRTLALGTIVTVAVLLSLIARIRSAREV